MIGGANGRAGVADGNGAAPSEGEPEGVCELEMIPSEMRAAEEGMADAAARVREEVVVPSDLAERERESEVEASEPRCWEMARRDASWTAIDWR